MRPSDLIDSIPIPHSSGTYAPLQPHQRIMFDRAVYAAAVQWDNDQYENARTESSDDSVNLPDDMDVQAAKSRRSNRQTPQPQSTVEIDKANANLDKVKTKYGDLPVVAEWDGGSFDSLRIMGHIRMIPPEMKK